MSFEIDCWNKSTNPFDEREKEVKEMVADLHSAYLFGVKKKKKERSLEEALKDAKANVGKRKQWINKTFVTKCKINHDST